MRTSLEILFKSVRNILWIRGFGCTAHLHIHELNRTSELWIHSQNGIYLGTCKRFHRVKNMDGKHVTATRNVIFDEKKVRVFSRQYCVC